MSIAVLKVYGAEFIGVGSKLIIGNHFFSGRCEFNIWFFNFPFPSLLAKNQVKSASFQKTSENPDPAGPGCSKVAFDIVELCIVEQLQQCRADCLSHYININQTTKHLSEIEPSEKFNQIDSLRTTSVFTSR